MNTTEMTISQLLRQAWDKGKKHFVGLLLLAMTAPAANFLLQGFLLSFMPQAQQAAAQQHPLRLVCVVLISSLLSLVCFAAIVLLAAGKAQNAAQAFKAGLTRLPRLLGGMVLFGLGCFVLCAVPAAVLFGLFYAVQAQAAAYGLLIVLLLLLVAVFMGVAGVYWILLPYRLILSDEKIFDTFKTAFMLTRGRFWRTLGFLLALSLLGAGLLFVVSLAAGVFIVLGLLLQTTSLMPLIQVLFLPVTALGALIMQLPMLTLYLNRTGAAGPEDAPQRDPSLEGKAG